MKIIRNEEEFELTKEELLEAYEEQQLSFAKEKILQNLSKYTSTQEYQILCDWNPYLELAATTLIELQNKGLSYGDAIIKAIRSTKDEPIQSLFSVQELKFLAGLYRIGIYTSPEIGLDIIPKLAFAKEEIPETLTELFQLYNPNITQVYKFCDQLTPEAITVIKTKIVPELEYLSKRGLHGLELKTFLDYVNMVEEAEVYGSTQSAVHL